ncbi:PREDICTED: neprilysin-2-like [Diuraphis noxia]|uniref:neprilysin-2-like n=1 Tax=Diuraphis noxia TaxID=143948 RepID=UPI000763647E|nr:PREDICTED: neprilysin-2-like [Diuraphis noxia]
MHLFDRKLQDVLLSGRRVPEKWIIGFLAVVSCIGLTLTVIKIGGGMGLMDTMCMSDECLFSADSIMRSIDVDVEPCDNFYEFACGKWQYSHQRENGKPNNWFAERSRVISVAVTKILEEPDRDTDLKSLKQARRLYRTCLDTDTLNNLQYEPVFQVLEKMGLPRKFPDLTTTSYFNGSVFNVAKSLALIERYLGIDAMLQMSLELDPSNNRTILSIGPITNFLMPLPEPLFDYHRNRVGGHRARRGFAFIEDLATNRLVKAKMKYMMEVIMTMFPYKIFSSNILATNCFKIILMEVALKKNVDTEKKGKEYTINSLKDYMHSKTNHPLHEKLFDWQSFIDNFVLESNLTWNMDDKVLVHDPEYFLELQSMLSKTSLEEIQQFIWWKVVEGLISHTTTDMINYKVALNEFAIPSYTKMTRPEFCTAVSRAFAKGPIAYEFYVRDDLKVTTAKVKTMIKQLQNAFGDLIKKSNWTDEATKQMTTLKANAMKIGVGYPKIFEKPDELDKIYEHVIVQEGQYLKTMLDIKAYEISLILENVGHPINMDAQKLITTDPLEVNAFYSRTDNSINIPPGILQIPFFNKGVDVVNYGAIGTILGHEISHGFDIEGKDYDIHGRKTSQWSPKVIQEYLVRAQCFIEQYDKFMLNSNVNLNGTLTLAENMADNVGLKQSWRAYKSQNINQKSSLPGLTEYSNDQLFFLSYANVWCQNSEDKNSENVGFFNFDEHSPSVFRVLGSLRNSPEFSEVWKCPVGSPMNPSKKCFMW